MGLKEEDMMPSFFEGMAALHFNSSAPLYVASGLLSYDDTDNMQRYTKRMKAEGVCSDLWVKERVLRKNELTGTFVAGALLGFSWRGTSLEAGAALQIQAMGREAAAAAAAGDSDTVHHLHSLEAERSRAGDVQAAAAAADVSNDLGQTAGLGATPKQLEQRAWPVTNQQLPQVQPADSLQGRSPAAAAAAVGLQRNDPPLGERSRAWAPLVLNRCTPDMPRHYAPCLVGSGQDPHVVYGEELVYPDFSMPEPGFVSKEHAAIWRSTVKGIGDYLLERFSLWHGRAYWTGQRGQNVVLRNILFDNNPPSDTWAHEACTKPDTTHRFLKPLAAGKAPQWTGRAVLVNTPDGAYFQHFMDRLHNVLVQNEGWRVPGTKIAAGHHPNSGHVRDVWEVLRAGQEVLHSANKFSVEELVFSCRTPFRHPFFRLRLQELMGLPDPAPVEQRRVVLYFSRNHGGAKPERHVNNEDELLQAIQALLAERGRGEELVVFNSGAFPHAADMARYLHANVSAIVGPHGGAMTNLPWAAPHTLVVELWPTSRPHHAFWAESHLVHARYWCIVINTTAPMHHMTVDPAHVTGVLRAELGRRGRPEEYVMPFYFWENTLEGQLSTDGFRK